VKTPARTTRTLLLAVDFSRPASRAVPYAIKLASVLNLSLTVVHVLQAPPGFTSWTPVTRRSLDPLRTKAMLELGRVIRFANDNQVPAKYKLLAGVPEDAILQTADEIRAGLIVMGTHGRSGLDRLKLGSVADAVLRRAHCPVFTIRAAAGGHPAWPRIFRPLPERRFGTPPSWRGYCLHRSCSSMSRPILQRQESRRSSDKPSPPPDPVTWSESGSCWREIRPSLSWPTRHARRHGSS